MLSRTHLAVRNYYDHLLGYMNDEMRKKFNESTRNPFDFQYIKQLNSADFVDDLGPCVVMAAPGGLQGGQSRKLFDKWCHDKKNGVVFCCFVAHGILCSTFYK